MKLVTFAGPPSAGKTSAILKMVDHLLPMGLKIGVVKFDALTTSDDPRFQQGENGFFSSLQGQPLAAPVTMAAAPARAALSNWFSLLSTFAFFT